MKKTIVTFSMVSLLMLCSHIHAATGKFFNVSVNNYAVGVQSIPSGRTYSQASIRINTPGYELYCPSSNSLAGPAKSCQFSTSDTSTTYFSILGPTNTVNITLCLNGIASITCEQLDVSITALAYVVNQSGGGGSVSICPVNKDGSFATCSLFTDSTLHFPLTIVFNPQGTFAYINNFTNSQISVCPVNQTTGMLSTCTAYSGGNSNTNGANGMTLNTDGSYAYVSHYNAGVWGCPILSNGGLGTCVLTSFNFPYPQSASVNIESNYLYVGSYFSNEMYICRINKTDNSLENCQIESNSTFNYTQGAKLRNGGTVAYVGNANNSTISVCSANVLTGLLSNCTALDGNGTFDFSAHSAIQIFTTSPYSRLYAPNNGNDTVTTCPLLSDNTFGTCFVNDGNGTFSVPSGITLR